MKRSETKGKKGEAMWREMPPKNGDTSQTGGKNIQKGPKSPAHSILFKHK